MQTDLIKTIGMGKTNDDGFQNYDAIYDCTEFFLKCMYAMENNT